MKPKSLLVHAALLGVGIAIGRFLPNAMQEAVAANGKGAIVDPAKAVRTRVSDRDGDRSVRDQFGANAEHPRAASTSILPEGGEGIILVPSTLIGELSRAAGVRTMGQDLFSRDSRIEQALGITDREKADIQTAWRTSRQRIHDLETSTMKSEEIDEWSVRITVPDLSQSMAALESDFRSAVDRTLGENRSMAFLAAKQVDGMFSPPAGDRFYTVTTEEIGDGRWRYRMTLEGPEGSRVWVGENIPDEIRHLTDAAGILPALKP